MLLINHLCNDSLFGRQRCQNHRPGSPQRRVQKPEVLHRPTPVTPYCDGGLHRTPDRRPAAKIRIRNDPPQPPRKRSAQSGSGGEPNAAANLFQKSGVSGMTGASEEVESAERTGLPNIRCQLLRKTAPAGRTTPPEILCHPRKNTICVTSPPSEHPPSSGKIAHAGRTGAPNIRRPAEERHSGPSAARRNYDCTTPKTTKIPPARKEWSKRIQSEKLFVFLREN